LIKKILINILIICFLISSILFNFNKFIRINNVLPDFILIFTVLNGIFFGPIYGMIFGFACGLSFEIVSQFPIIGFYALIYTLIGYSTSITRILYVDNAFTATITILLLILLKSFLFLSLGFLFLNIDEISFYFKNIFIIQTIYTVIISIPVFLIYKRFNPKLRKSYNHDV